MIASLNQSSSLSSFGAALMPATTSTARPLRETAEQQRRILLQIDAQTNSAPLYIKKGAKQVRQQMAAIVAAGASLLGSQRSRRPRPPRSCSGSAAIQSRPGWLAGSAGPATS